MRATRVFSLFFPIKMWLSSDYVLYNFTLLTVVDHTAIFVGIDAATPLADFIVNGGSLL